MKRRQPTLRVRLGAVALGVVLVAGSVAMVFRSNVEHDAGHGIGMRLVRLFRQIAAPSSISLSHRFSSTWVATGWAVDGMVQVTQAGDVLPIAIGRYEGTYFEHIDVQCVRYGTGIWGATGERDLLGVWFYLDAMPAHPPLNLMPDEREEAIRVLNGHLMKHPHPAVPHFWVDMNLLSTGVTERSRVLWSGYAINAATLAGFGLIGWGSIGAFVAVRARRRIGKHQCTQCRYDLRGLGEGAAVCPECGAERDEWPEKDTD